MKDIPAATLACVQVNNLVTGAHQASPDRKMPDGKPDGYCRLRGSNPEHAFRRENVGKAARVPKPERGIQ